MVLPKAGAYFLARLMALLAIFALVGGGPSPLAARLSCPEDINCVEACNEECDDEAYPWCELTGDSCGEDYGSYCTENDYVQICTYGLR